ncbi:MAG: VWA domain-containing protein [Tabrizicola sp.]|nr:VWA domain-containing protein [Tabrizicola sp.]
MSRIDFEPWEPEESVGKLWHAFASRLDGDPIHDGARVSLSEVAGRLAVLFRGLGGDPAVEIKPVAMETSHHRLSLLRRLGTWAETSPRASFDGATLRLPESLAAFPDPRANAALYLWLAAAAVALRDETPPDVQDPLQADLAAIALAQAMTEAALRLAPGYRKLHADLCEATLLFRRTRSLPPVEAGVEARVRAALGQKVDLPALPAKAPRGYRPFRPVALWPDLRPLARSEHTAVEARATDGPPEESEEKTARKARRRKSDQADRNDSFILHKFEAILSMTEFLNLNRRVEDDDEDTAKKAADDQDEIGLAQVSKAPATRLKLHLDLAPEDVDREQISGAFTYPEWDVRTGSYIPSHARVLHSRAEASDLTPPFRADPRASARIRAVRRQFEALRPSLVSMPGYPDGDVLDTERAVRARVDFLSTGEETDRVWRQTRPERRDLAVSILLDVSRSTESAIPGHGHDGRSVIDIEREALAALSWGLDACGDSFAIHAFSSLKRDRVFVQEVKGFAEPMAEAVEHRISALKPGHYTRLGAAIRHTSALLTKESRKRRLLLVITDGKPNDLDHYEGRHGIEDSRMAVLEARRAGHSVFGITVDRDGKSWFPRLFGQGAFALIPHPEKLTQALPQIYRQLVTG